MVEARGGAIDAGESLGLDAEALLAPVNSRLRQQGKPAVTGLPGVRVPRPRVVLAPLLGRHDGAPGAGGAHARTAPSSRSR